MIKQRFYFENKSYFRIFVVIAFCTHVTRCTHILYISTLNDIFISFDFYLNVSMYNIYELIAQYNKYIFQHMHYVLDSWHHDTN